MRMNEEKNKGFSGIGPRLKELFIDWLFICGYLIVLFIMTLLVYLLVFKGIPELTSIQAQLIATFTSVIPIIMIFSMMEGRKGFASWGKQQADLKIIYNGAPMKGSFIRNTLKFLPWQFGHMSTINGIYNGFESPYSIAFLTFSMGLAMVYVLMVFIRKDNRHLADILAGSTVVKIHKN